MSAHHRPIRRPTVRAAALALAAGLTSLDAQAAHVYAYTGALYDQIIVDLDPLTPDYTTSMHITGSFTVSNALAPNLPNASVTGQVTDFSFFDGLHTVSAANAKSAVFFVGTDAQGDIDFFNILVDTAYPAPSQVGDHRVSILLSSSNLPTHASAIVWECTGNNGCGGELEVQSGRSNNAAGLGVWIGSATADVPEPASWSLVCTGLLAVGTAARRRRAVSAVARRPCVVGPRT